MLVPKTESLFGLFAEKWNEGVSRAEGVFYILIVIVKFPFQSLYHFLSHQQRGKVHTSPIQGDQPLLFAILGGENRSLIFT